MRIDKNWVKGSERKEKTDTYREKWSLKAKEKINEEYQESMLEDMRGPFEGMEEIPNKQ